MKPYLLKIGNFEVRIYSLMYILSLFLSIYIVTKDTILRKRITLSNKEIEDLGFITLLSGLVGARVYYVIFRWSELYSENPISALYIWNGGLAIHGGIIGGFLGILIYSMYKKQKFLAVTDIVTIPLILSQGLGRIGNLANGEVHGVPTFTPLKVIFNGTFNEWWKLYQSSSIEVKKMYSELVPWGIVFPSNTPAGQEFPNYALHPAMLYEMVLNFGAFAFLYFYLRKKEPKAGIISFTYLILYAVIRSFVSLFRAEDLMFFGFRAPHVISLIMLVIGVVGIIYINRKKVD